MQETEERMRTGSTVVVDLETTGFCVGEAGREDAQILEIAALRMEELRVTEHFHTYVACSDLPEEITALTGIDAQTLAGAPSVREALMQFAAFAEGAVLAAYHMPFDGKFLDYYARQSGVTLPSARVDIRALPGAGGHLRAALEALCAPFTLPASATCSQCAEAAAWLLVQQLRTGENH